MNKEQKEVLKRAKEVFKNVVITIFFIVFTFLCIAVVFSSHTY